MISSFKLYPKIYIKVIIKSSKGPTLPRTAPKDIRTAADAKEDCIKLIVLREIVELAKFP
jgi:hypothetical protein